MKRLLITLLLVGCSAADHTEIPDITPDEFVPAEAVAGEDCELWSFPVATYLPRTPVPIPFSGTRDTIVDLEKPEWYGSKVVYPVAMSWNAEWVTWATFANAGDNAVFAVWQEGSFQVDPSVDLSAWFADMGNDRVRMIMRVSAKGVKPAGKQKVRTLVSLRLCDPVGTTPPTVTGGPSNNGTTPTLPAVDPIPGGTGGCPSC